MARHFQRAVIIAFGNQFAEPCRAGDIGALTDIHKANILGQGKWLQAGQAQFRLAGRNIARAIGIGRTGNSGNMFRRRAATPAQYIDQTGLGKLANNRRHLLGKLVIFAKLIGQAGIRVNADIGVGNAGNLRRIGTHFFRPQGAIQAY